MVFIERAAHDLDKHSAQIAFPGGKSEPGDVSLRHTALREAHEEIGLDPSTVEVLGEITPLPIPVSRFKVFPYLAFTRETPVFVPQASEVARIIELPVKDLIAPKVIQSSKMKLSTGQTISNVPIFNIDGTVIWGATAMILSEIVHLVKNQ